MRKKQIALACLFIIAIVGGYVARCHVDRRDPIAKIRQQGTELPRSLSAYASNSASSDIGTRSDVDLRPLQIFYDVLLKVREEYVEPIQKSQERDLTYGALRVMLDSLQDPLTRFYEPNQAKLVTDASLGKFHGIGAVIIVKRVKQNEITEEQLHVISTIPDSPARKAGILPGDVISEIDGKAVLPYNPLQRAEKLIKDMRNGKLDESEVRKILEGTESNRIKNGIGFQKVLDMLAGSDSKEYTLTIVRAGVKAPLKIKVGSADSSLEPVTYTTLNNGIGYIHLNLIIKAAEPKFAEAIADFKEHGVTSVVLDLRNSPGGTIESAQSIAGTFIPKKKMTVLQLPKGKRNQIQASVAPSSGVWTGPVVVLVNGGTSGVSEVLAAALRDADGAKLVGKTTVGANLQQTFMQLHDGSAVSITTGKYLTPNGIDYENKGLVVDIAAPATGLSPGEDLQLNRAVEVAVAGKA
jgi:carboxyl-terminal processing protease